MSLPSGYCWKATKIC